MQEQQRVKNDVDAINIVRVTAALCIFMAHTRGVEKESFFKPDGLTFLLRTSAWGGVWMFFVLSGYLAGKSYALGRYEPTVSSALRYYRCKFRDGKSICTGK